jgi:hypothetical protein
MPDVKRVLILGSGFSKAIFPVMPLVGDLREGLQDIEALRQEPYASMASEPELLLSHLALSQPWRTTSEGLSDRALFVQAQTSLANQIATCEAGAFQTPTPEWAGSLLRTLHDSRTPVITLNYDTVVERLLLHFFPRGPDSPNPPREYNLYDLPLSPIWARAGGGLLGTRVETFHLIKLHGSINWFYSGPEGYPGEQVYYRVVNSDSPFQDHRGRDGVGPGIECLCSDKTPLIIPPTAEKSQFYGNKTIRALWMAARTALAQAEEILCVGYSFPATDLTMRLFLQSVARPRRVVIVNNEQPGSPRGLKLVDRYKEAFPGVELDCDTFMCEHAVEKMTDYLTS